MNLYPFTIPDAEIRRYKSQGLARLDVGTDPNWSRLLPKDGYSIDVSTLLEHQQPVEAWVGESLRAPMVFIASAKFLASEKPRASRRSLIQIGPAKKMESLDVIIRQTKPNLWYDRPVELIVVYQQ